MADASVDEARILTQGVGIYERTDLAEYQLHGEDQRTWLNGQVTNDVRELTRGQSVYALAVTVRGRIMADVWVLDRGEQLAVLLPKQAAQPVLESFESQIIMEDVEVVVAPDTHVLSLQGPKAAELAKQFANDPRLQLFPGDELGLGGFLLLTTAAELPEVHKALLAAAAPLAGGPVSLEGYELCRLRLGRPRFGADFDQSAYPQEAGLKERAVSFNKGCYLGQEVICTLENRGKVARVQHQLRSSQPLTPGAELRTAEGTTAGKLTSVAQDPEHSSWLALGYVKRSAVGGTPLYAEQAEVEVGPALG